MPRARSRWATNFYRAVGKLPFPVPDKWAPVFLVGCGRSGTTIVGQVLNRHRDLSVVNEPRYIWRAINPETDIWYAQANPFGGKLSMDAADAADDQAIKARRMFYFRLLMDRRRYLLEKLPINSFRIAYLRALFPECRFVHLIRHGLEVAHSIARTGDRWYGPNEGRKWRALAKFGASHGIEPSFLGRCQTDLEKGLVEWTLSLGAACESLRQFSTTDHLDVRYDQLINDPSRVLSQIEAFLHLERDETMHEHARLVVQRRSETAASLVMPHNTCDRTRELLQRFDFH